MFVKHIQGRPCEFEELINEALLELSLLGRGIEHIPLVLEVKYVIESGVIHAFIEWEYVEPEPFD